MKYIFYRGLTLLLRGLVKLPYCPSVIMEFVVASSNGYAKRKFDVGEYDKVHKELISVVSFNLPDDDPYLARARYIMFCLYYKGYGVEVDSKVATEYLTQSIKGGDDIAIKQYKHMINNNKIQPVKEIEDQLILIN